MHKEHASPPPSPESALRRKTRWLTGCRGSVLTGSVLLFLSVGVAIALFRNSHPSTMDESSADLPSRTPHSTATAALTPTDSTQSTPIPIQSSSGLVTADDIHRMEEVARLGRGSINTLALRPDGVTLAVGGSLGVWLYDIETLQLLGLLEGHTKPTTDIAWSPDGNRLVSASQDGTLRVWHVSTEEGGFVPDAVSAQENMILGGHVGSVSSVAWSPDGGYLATGGWDDTVRIWDISEERFSLVATAAGEKEQPLLSSHTEAVLDLTWSPDGTQLASARSDGRLQVWNVSVKKPDAAEGVATPRKVAVLEGHTKAVTSVVWSPTGAQLASASEDRSIRIWSVSDSESSASGGDGASGRRPLVLQGHTSYIESLAWSLDGSLLASGARDRTVRVWDVVSGAERRVLQGHSQAVNALAWLPDGSELVSGGKDGALRVWNVGNGTELRAMIGHEDAVLSLAWSPDGTQLAFGNSDGSVEIWSLTSAEPGATGVITAATQHHRLTGHKNEVHSVAWSPNGSQLAAAGGILDTRVWLWNVTIPGEARIAAGHTSLVKSLAWAPDGSQLASASWDNTVRIWDANGRPLHVFQGHSDWALSVAWSPDGTQLASGGKDSTVRLWRVADGEQLQVLQGHNDQVTNVTWSPEGGRLASVSRDNTLRIWDMAKGQVSWARQTPGAMASVAWSPDGALLAMASESQDDLVRIWDVNTGEELYILKGHVDTVNAVAWSPDGAHLATASADGTVRVWGYPADH